MSASRNSTVMIVDDDRSVLQGVAALIQGVGLLPHIFDSACAALSAYWSLRPDVVLADVNMPAMSGIKMLKEIRSFDQETPVIIISGDPSVDSAIEALRLGAFDYLLKPCAPDQLVSAVQRGLDRRQQVRLDSAQLREMEEVIVATTCNLERALENQVEITRELIDRLTIAAELRDEETGSHNIRIGRYVRVLAAHMGLDDASVELIGAASPMHDVGKIVIPDAILFKPGPLTEEEFEVLKSHTLVGAQIFSGSRHRQLQLAASIALTHHERWDGSGYPRGLAGSDIPLEGRIVMMADQYDALRSRRVYKLAYDHDTACRIILEGDRLTRPEHFDPDVMRAFRDTADRLADIFDKGQAEHVPVTPVVPLWGQNSLGRSAQPM